MTNHKLSDTDKIKKIAGRYKDKTIKSGESIEPAQKKHLELLSEANGITLLRDKFTMKVYAVRDNGILFSLQEL